MSDLDKKDPYAPLKGGGGGNGGRHKGSQSKMTDSQHAPARYKGAGSGQPHHRRGGKGKGKGKDRKGRGGPRGGPSDDRSLRTHSGNSSNGSGPGAGSTRASCPVCSVNLPASQIDAHLDGCLASGKSPRNKKGIDISHLVEFAPRPRASTHERPRPSRQPRSKQTASRRAYSRETFLQSNCRFRVKFGSDYTAVLSDADQMVDWDKILEVLITVTEEPRCPVCLGPPVAARITRCGHMYCWPCMLHHLAESEKAWQSCPLCDDFVYSRDLRPVRWKIVDPPEVGRPLSLTLLKRERGTMLPLLADEWASTPSAVRSAPVLLLTSHEVSREYFKIIPTTVAEMSLSYTRQGAELREAFAESPDKYITEALEALSRQSFRHTDATAATGIDVGWSSGTESDVSEADGLIAWGAPLSVAHASSHRTRTISMSSTSSVDSNDMPGGGSGNVNGGGGGQGGMDVPSASLSRHFGGSSGSAAWAATASPTASQGRFGGGGDGHDDPVAYGQHVSQPHPVPTVGPPANGRGGSGGGARQGEAAESGATPTPLSQSWESNGSWGEPAIAPLGSVEGAPPPRWNTVQQEQGSYGWWGPHGGHGPSVTTSTTPGVVMSTPSAPGPASTDSSCQTGAVGGAGAGGHTAARSNKPLTGSTDGVYAYYQAADGQAVFLHSLNMRCLLHEFGSVDNCPPVIKCPVVEIERDVMTHELRKRHRYLGHLPVSCELLVCELDLRSVVSHATLAHFAGAIDARRSARKRRAAYEKKQARQQAKNILKRQQEQEERFRLLRQHDRESGGGEPSQTEPAFWDACPTPAGLVAGEPHRDPESESEPYPPVGLDETPPAHRSFSRAVGGVLFNDIDDPPLGRSFEEDHPPLAAAAARVKSGGRAGGGGGGADTHTPPPLATAVSAGPWGVKKSQPSSSFSSSLGSGPSVPAAAARAEYEAPSSQESFFAGALEVLSASSSAIPESPSPQTKRAGKKGKNKFTTLVSNSTRRHRD